jgi:anthranilate phosphoribosyltransferase
MLPQEIASVLQALSRGEDLTTGEVRAALNAVGAIDRVSDPAEPDGMLFLGLALGLMAKGPTSDELIGWTQSIRDQTPAIEQPAPGPLVDLSGTGGDRLKTFNVSSTASVVVASCGLRVAKQATRGYTGATGSADVFSAVGIDPFAVTPETAVRQLDEVGLTVFYPPSWSDGFATRIAFLRKLSSLGLGLLTPWHLVAWLHSPFALTGRLYGVFELKYVELLADIFREWGPSRVLVVHGMDGLDEISPIGVTQVAEIKDGAVEYYEIAPEDLGLPRASINDIATYTPAERVRGSRDPAAFGAEGRRRNLQHFVDVLANRERGARRNMVAINAGAALYVGGVAGSLHEGAERAQEAIESGAALNLLKRLVESSGGSFDLDRARAGSV